MIPLLRGTYWAAAIGIAGSCPAAAVAQAASYPSKPIRLVNPYAPGGTVDIVARVVAQKLNEAWGLPVIVDNRPGAGTTIGTEIVAHAVPDGYTLLQTSGTIAANVTLYPKLSFDPVKNLAPVALVVQRPIFSCIPRCRRDRCNSSTLHGPDRASCFRRGRDRRRIDDGLFRSLARIEMLHVP